MKEGIDSIIAEILLKFEFQNLINSKEFFFDKAKVLFNQFRDYDIEDDLLLSIEEEYTGKIKYVDYCEQIENAQQKEMALIIGQLIAYCDDKAANKNIWNLYDDNRVLARAGVWQTHWIKNFIKYKRNSNNNNSISSDSIRHAIEYLEDPSKGLCMLSKNHRDDLSKFLFDKPYQEANKVLFVSKLKDYFSRFKLQPANNENLTRIITDVFYSDEIRDYWMTEKVDATKVKYQGIIKEYKTYLVNPEYNEFFKWQAVQHYRNTIEFNSESFALNFKEALKKNKRLIYGNLISYINTLGQYYPDFQKNLISNLFNEKEKIQQRISVFLSQSKLKLQDVRDRLGDQKLSNTQDESSIAAYLSFQYPEKYSFYKAEIYNALCKYLGKRTKKPGFKLEHFWRLLDPLKKLVKKDQELINLLNSAFRLH